MVEVVYNLEITRFLSDIVFVKAFGFVELTFGLVFRFTVILRRFGAILRCLKLQDELPEGSHEIFN